METEVVVHSYEWTTGKDSETGYTTIHGWCLDRDSKPNLLRFHDFDIFCYVELPLVLNNSYVRWQGYREKLIYDAICYKLGDDRPHRYMFVQKEKLYFYKGKGPNGGAKTYPMLLLCFHSVSSMMACKKKLGYPFKVRGLKGGNEEIMVSVRVWETHIPLERKLLTLRDCRYCQWFKIKGIKVLGEDKISTLGSEFIEKLRMRVKGTLKRGRKPGPSKATDGMVSTDKPVVDTTDNDLDGDVDDEDLEIEDVAESAPINEVFVRMQKIAGLIK